MLMALGFEPVKAAAVALIANTAPVAFGALATPITTLATVTAGAGDDPRFDVDTLGAMVGRQTPFLALVVPLILVFVVDGRRGLRQTWPSAVVCGITFAVAQFAASNYLSVPLADIVASLAAAAVMVLHLRTWSPSEVLTAEAIAATGDAGTGSTGGVPAGGTGAGGAGGGGGRGHGRPVGGGSAMPSAGGGGSVVTETPSQPDTSLEVVRAYAPYVVIIAIFAIANISAVKDALAQEPWTYAFAWPGLDVLNTAGDPVATTTFGFNWLPAAGTLMVIAGIVTGLVLRISPATMVSTYAKTYVELRSAIVTVMAVLGLAYVMNLSGQTGSLGAWLAGAGGAFALLSPILGWIGVAVTGSDTSANALFGGLQAQTASSAGLDPVLMAAANSSGGVLGKMISPQNLAIAAAAVGMAGREGDIFRKVIGWSLLLLVVMCVIVGLQATPVLGWMVP
jgi:lactate permease